MNITLAALTIAAGLSSRRYAASLPPLIAQYAGDALWATLVFWLLGICRPRVSAGRLAMATIAIAFAVEGSQLYHSAWIDSIRDTTIGALVLGSGFLWSDLVCYAAGAALAAGLDVMIAVRKQR